VEGGGGTIVEGTAAGVPLTIPVLGSTLRPSGRSGLTLYALGDPIVALANGASAVIATPTAYTGAGEAYAKPDGEIPGPSTVRVRVAVVLPVALLAVIV
jgi:hypothetical protein